MDLFTGKVAEIKKINEKRLDACFQKHEIFFAFSKKQFLESVKKVNLAEGEKMVGLGHGMFCKKSAVTDFIEEFDKVCEQNNKNLIDEAGIEEVIKYELVNHECYYTGSPEDAIEALATYGINDADLINKVFKEEWLKQDLM